MMKTNEALQKDVQDAIKWEPLLNAAEIGVTVKDSVVTLTGVVDSYMKKAEAEDAAKSVAGVKAVVEKIEIKFGDKIIDDNTIADEILNAYKWNWKIPSNKIKVKVERGCVTLEGLVEWNYQKENARKIVSFLEGVKCVTNKIEIKSEVDNKVEKMNIENSFKRNWALSNKNIQVTADNHNVKLVGVVDSMYQKDEAERIAYKAPGVWVVENDLIVEYVY